MTEQADLAMSRDGTGSKVQFRQLTGFFGAEINGLDLGQPLKEADRAALVEGLDKYRVMFIRGPENLSPRAFLEFASVFGIPETEEHPSHPQLEGCPGVYELVSNAAMTENSLIDTWHTDGATREDTRYISFLRAVEVPEFGRDTAFADMVAAYEKLSAPMRAFLDPLTGEYNWGSQKPGSASVYHPLVLTDRQTGQKALYANRLYSKSIVGLRPDESASILEFLVSQARIPEFQLRISWEPGTIAIWNNELVQHYLVFDVDFERVMHRVMVS